MRTAVAMGLAVAAMLAGPAMADVKAGVDAWTRGDYAKAIGEWRAPAIAGDADAQFNLGQAYKLGRGVPVEPSMAEGWFRKAALQGHIQAEDNYALALFQGNKYAEALPWLEKSVARGEPRTQLILGTMLFNGDGAAKDWVRAYALMTRASARGLPAASQTLAQMDQYIPPEDRQKGTALARDYEAQAARAPIPGATTRIVAGGPTAPTPAATPTGLRTTNLPPSRKVTPAARPTPKPTPSPTRTPAPAPASVAARPIAQAARPAPVVAGRYRVQLGAFRDEGNARALWGRIGARVGGQPTYARTGGVVRLQAGPFANRAAANRACAGARAAGNPCVLVAP